MFSTVYCLLNTVYCMFSTVYCMFSTVYGMFSTVYCMFSTVYCMFTLSVCLRYGTIHMAYGKKRVLRSDPASYRGYCNRNTATFSVVQTLYYTCATDCNSFFLFCRRKGSFL
jgi:hypothetical protein